MKVKEDCAIGDVGVFCSKNIRGPKEGICPCNNMRPPCVGPLSQPCVLGLRGS